MFLTYTVRRDSKSNYEDGQVNQRIPEPGRQKKAGSIQLAPPKEKDLSKIVNVFAVSNEQFFTRKTKFYLEKKMFK